MISNSPLKGFFYNKNTSRDIKIRSYKTIKYTTSGKCLKSVQQKKHIKGLRNKYIFKKFMVVKHRTKNGDLQ